MAKPKICVITATPLTIHFFFKEHLKLMALWADVTVVVNNDLDNEINLSDLPITIKHVRIIRAISVWRDFVGLLAILKLFSHERYDMVISLTPKAGFLSMLAAKKRSIQVRLHIFQGEVWASKSGLARLLLLASDKVIAYFATNVMAVSESQRLFLIKNNIAAKIEIKILGRGSISGVDIKKFRPDQPRRALERKRHQIPENAVVALFLGRVTKDKGVFELLSAFSVVAKEQKKLWLVIAGPDEERLVESLRSSVDPELVGRVIFTGFQFAPENLICAADFLCLFSRREGFGTCAIEAAACAVPVLGTDIHGLNDAVINSETGVLVPLNEPHLAVDGMRKLSSNASLRLRLGLQGRKRVKTIFDSVKVVKAYDDEFYRLIQRH